MSMLERYKAAEKVMPYNAKKLVLNINPSVKFEGDNLIVKEEYFYKGEVCSRSMVKNLKTGKVTRRPLPKTTYSNPEYNPEISNPVTSSDGKYSLHAYKNNLVLTNNKLNKQYTLTEDGNEFYSYGEEYFQRGFQAYLENNKPTICKFSPDGKKALVNVLVAENIGNLTITQVFNNKDTKTPARPKDFVYHEWFPYEEDALVLAKLAVVDCTTRKLLFIDKEPFYFDEFPGFNGSTKWDEDSNGFIFIESDKCCQQRKLFHVSLEDLKANELGCERTETFFQETSQHGRINKDFGYGITILRDKKTAIWLTAKEDLNDLYMFDLVKHEFGKKITSDEYNVSSIISVDEDNKKIYFMGSNMDNFSDPYFGGLCVINFDGTGFKLLTTEDSQHSITMSYDNYYYVDTYSTIDSAPVTMLRSVDGKVNEVLLVADIKKLLKAGYIMPKRTKVTLDDGMTLYGCIVLPKNYNPKKKYPVIDYVYGGPQTINTPKQFTAWAPIPGREAYGGLEGFAQLGFIGVIIDGRGTPHRGKKMHDISFRNLQGVDGLCDHIPFLQNLQKEYPGLDLDRVGIWGNSAGGYSSTRALLVYPDFYKVAVSSAGDHDNSIYNAPWALRYQSAWDDEAYLAQDSAQLVDNLKGKLMLVHGLLDDNVHPSQSFRMIQYFNKANKDVDLLVLPDTDHNCPGNVYFMRRRFDYFVRNLMGVEPPKNFKFSGQK